MKYPDKYGHNTEYRMLHYWVEKNLGKPLFCVECGSTTSKHYDWANISGEYKRDISDWQRMCRKCHLKRDFKKDFCVNNHKLDEDNLYITPKGYRECRKCRKERRSYDPTTR